MCRKDDEDEEEPDPADGIQRATPIRQVEHLIPKTNPESTSGALPLPTPASYAGESGSGPARRRWKKDQGRRSQERSGGVGSNWIRQVNEE
jgi:hypothetical protein